MASFIARLVIYYQYLSMEFCALPDLIWDSCKHILDEVFGVIADDEYENFALHVWKTPLLLQRLKRNRVVRVTTISQESPVLLIRRDNAYGKCDRLGNIDTL